MKVLIIENLKSEESVWWWQYLPKLNNNCHLSIAKIPEINFFRSVIPLLKLYSKLSNYDLIITHQDCYATFLFSFLDTLLKKNKCKHYINEFITKEKSKSIYSFFKYLFLKFSFTSVHCIMCSSRPEMEYYQKTLSLKKTIFRFVSLATDPKFLKFKSYHNGSYIISAGRTGRDYLTLVKAVEDLHIRLLIVADHLNLKGINLPKNVEVMYNISLDDLTTFIASSRLVVLPLQNRKISIGQSVLLHAMALGKPLIVTKNAATIDYIKNDETGIFVEPENVDVMKNAIIYLWNNPQKATQIGANAKKAVQKDYLIRKKIMKIQSIIKESLYNKDLKDFSK